MPWQFLLVAFGFGWWLCYNPIFDTYPRGWFIISPDLNITYFNHSNPILGGHSQTIPLYLLDWFKENSTWNHHMSGKKNKHVFSTISFFPENPKKKKLYFIGHISQIPVAPILTIINWLVVYLPLWKIWVRQLGLLFPNMESHKIHVPNHQPVNKSSQQ